MSMDRDCGMGELRSSGGSGRFPLTRDLELHIPLPMSALPLPPTHQQGPRSASPRLGGAFSGHSPLASAASAPHVTISNAGGSVVQYHPPLYDISPAHFQHELDLALVASSPSPSPSPISRPSTSRAWRSHSLTPLGGGCPSSSSLSPAPSPCGLSVPAEWNKQARSNSLTLSNVHDPNAGVGVTFHSASSFSDVSGNGIDKNIDEIVRRLPDGSGMRELQEWLKSLRLHKYTLLLLEFTYEELLGLSEADLERKQVTTGARGKILKEIATVKERPAKMRELAAQIEAISRTNDLARLERILPELEKVILMPLKPTVAAAAAAAAQRGICSSCLSPSSMMTSSCRGCYPPISPRGAGGGPIGSNLTSSRHNSGNSVDSGTTDHDLQQLSMSSGDSTANIPGELFEILKKIGSTVLMAESFHHGVVVHFVALLERCASKEAFSAPQKQHFSAWIQRLKTVWNPTMRKSLNNKNKTVRGMDLARRPSMPGCAMAPIGTSGSRQLLMPSAAVTVTSGMLSSSPVPPCIPPPPPPPPGFIRASSPMTLKQHHPSLTPSLSLLPDRSASAVDVGAAPLQRRSVPDINVSSSCAGGGGGGASLQLFPQMKRNSYQGDHRMAPLMDAEILDLSGMDLDAQYLRQQSQSHQQQQQQHRLSCGSSHSAFTTSPTSPSRRESTMSSDSGYHHMMTPFSADGGGCSRRASQMSMESVNMGGSITSRKNSQMSDRRDSQLSALSALGGSSNSRRSSSAYGMDFSVAPTADMMYHLAPGANRRDSAMSNDSLLSVESVRYGGGVSPGCGGGGGASSGCASAEGSTDSLLEQEMHNLSLSVTEQALE